MKKFFTSPIGIIISIIVVVGVIGYFAGWFKSKPSSTTPSSQRVKRCVCPDGSNHPMPASGDCDRACAGLI